MLKTSFIALAAVGLLNAGMAQAVTLETKTPVRPAEPMSVFTPSSMVRAQADVQIRRLHNLIVNKGGSDDSAFDKLDKMQKKLRGAK